MLSRNISIVHGIWAIPALIIIRLLRPFILIRVGTFFSNRIGHYAMDMGIQWIKRQTHHGKSVDLYWLDRPTCNKQLEVMANRNFPVYSWVKYIDIWNKYIPGGEAHSRPSHYNSRDAEGLLESSNVKMLEFTPDEESAAMEWLKSLGWSDGQPFICLLVRDEAYLKSEKFDDTYDWNYHSYRDSDIDTYIPAMEWLVSQGVWVLRMGKKMLKPAQVKHHMIIDYAFHKDKSDLLDVWLFANCNLCISTGSGPDTISDIYRSPILFLNYLPLTDMVSWSNSVNYPKNLIWKKTGRPLTLDDHLNHTLYETGNYENSDIGIINLSQEEILSVVKECWGRIQENWIDSECNISLQKVFWERLVSHKNSRNQHHYIHPEAKISTVFLNNNRSFLE